MDLHPVDIVIHILNIIVLFVVLRALLYKPVKKFMQAREDKIKAQKNEIAASKAEAEELKKKYEAKLAEADSDAKNIMREAGEKAQLQSTEIIKEAQARAKDILLQADSSADELRNKAAQSIRQDVVSTAADMAAKILSREIDEKDNADIADRFFTELESK